ARPKARLAGAVRFRRSGGRSDATKLHLHVARPVVGERAHAGAEVAIVVDVDLVTPGLSDLPLVELEPTEPLGRGVEVALALRAHVDDLPVRVHRRDELLETRIEPAREDDVGREREIFEVFTGARHAVPQDGLEAEV